MKAEAGAAVAKEDFAAAMSAMAKLRPAVDAFFDKVKVNDDDREGARESPEAAQRNPRRHARGRGFLEDRGVIFTLMVRSASSRVSNQRPNSGLMVRDALRAPQGEGKKKAPPGGGDRAGP